MAGSKKIGITGASGFIGRHLAKKLSEKYKLVLFSRKKTYSLKNSEWILKNISNCNKKDFEGIDILIHLAESPFGKNAKENYNLLKKILNFAIDAEVSDFYFASSYSVYGDRKTKADIYSKVSPMDEYSTQKVHCEGLINEANNTGKINGIVFRFCSIYGEGGKGLVDIIKNKIINKEDVKLDSYFYRQYMYVEDLIKLIYLILKNNPKYNIYNFEGEPLSTRALNQLLISMNINSTFLNNKKISYLCDGINSNPSTKVREYLSKFKE